MNDKLTRHDAYGEQFNQGLVPATEQEQKICEEKEKTIGALPVGFVKADNDKNGVKYYKLVKLDSDQLDHKIKAEQLRRLRNMDRRGVAQIVLQSISVGFTAVIAACAFIALFLLK